MRYKVQSEFTGTSVSRFVLADSDAEAIAKFAAEMEIPAEHCWVSERWAAE